MIQILFGTGLAVLVCLVALWKGGAPERWGAVILLAGWFITPLVDNRHGIRYGILGVDGLCLIGFLIISLKSRQLWTLLASGFMVDDVLVHLAMEIRPQIGDYTYASGLIFWGGYGLVAALGFGVWERRIDRWAEKHRSG